MRKRFGVFVLLLAMAMTLTLPSVALAKKALGLSASKFDFTALPGKTGRGEVYVINEGDQPIQVRVYAANQIVSPSGKLSYSVPTVDDDPLQSPASWVQVKMPEESKSIANVPYVELKPGQRSPVNFAVKIPQRAVPGDTQIILFFEMFDQGTAAEPQTKVLARVGARIKTHVLGAAVERIDVSPFVFPRFVVGSKAKYSYTIRNQGNIDKKVTTTLVSVDYNGSQAKRKPLLREQPVYANSNLAQAGVVEFSPWTIGPQRYRLSTQYKTGEEGGAGVVRSIDLNRSVWVFPLWLAVVLVLLVVGGSMYGAWHNGSKTTRRKLREEEYRRRIEELERELGQGESA